MDYDVEMEFELDAVLGLEDFDTDWHVLGHECGERCTDCVEMRGTVPWNFDAELAA